MRWRKGLLTASSVTLLAGCDDGQKQQSTPPKLPKIPSGVASRLAAEADQVAALTPGSCEARDAAARFRSDVIASIGSVPARYQEPLTSAANSLAERLASCVEPQPHSEPNPKPEEPKHQKPPKPHDHHHKHRKP
jgi:hypothetical protein